jgi:hypothetical protein
MASALSHPLFARAFPAMSRALEAGGIAGRRTDLLAGLAGQVIDVGAGTGPSFGHYPATVTRVMAVEPEPRLRALAAAAARAVPVPVEVTSGMADALPAAGASYDAAVVSFVLCTVPDPDAALAEIRRVLRPGRTCSAAATSAATPPPRSSAPGSPSPGWRNSCSPPPAPRSRSTSPGTPPHRAGSNPCGHGQLHRRGPPPQAGGHPGASCRATWCRIGAPADSCTARANSHSRTRPGSRPASRAIRPASPAGSAASRSSQLSMCCSTS